MHLNFYAAYVGTALTILSHVLHALGYHYSDAHPVYFP